MAPKRQPYLLRVSKVDNRGNLKIHCDNFKILINNMMHYIKLPFHYLLYYVNPNLSLIIISLILYYRTNRNKKNCFRFASSIDVRLCHATKVAEYTSKTSANYICGSIGVQNVNLLLSDEQCLQHGQSKNPLR